MRHVLIIFSIFLFSLTINSCSSDDGSKSADNTNTNDTTTTDDSTAWSGLLDNTSIPHWTAAEVVALLDSPPQLDNLTGCGHRNYMSISGGGSILYPDGIERSNPTGYYRHGSRYYVYDKKYEIRLGYWNDWLGLSDDIEVALDNYTKPRRIHTNITEYQDYLTLTLICDSIVDFYQQTIF